MNINNRNLGRPGINFFLCAAILAVASSAYSQTANPSPDAQAAPSSDPQIAAGQALYAGPCSSCHGDHGEGTAAGGPLTSVGTKYTDAKLITVLRTPTEDMTDGGMQPVKLNDKDMAALVKYLRQLH